METGDIHISLVNSNKRLRLEDANMQLQNDDLDSSSRASTPDSLLYRDFENPHAKRCMVAINSYEDPTDENILQWQEAQLSRCITENTLNRVVESYIDLFSDDSIRLEQSTIQMAIRMAIHEHGLQQNEEDEESQYEDAQQPVVPNGIQLNCNDTDINNASSSPLPSTSTQPANALCSSSNSSSSSTLCTDAGQRESSNRLDATSISSSAASSASIPDMLMRPISLARLVYDDLEVVEDYAYDDYSDAESEHLDHGNFLEAAVAVAIQKKGLASHSANTE